MAPAEGDAPSPDAHYFDARVKCCTYVPHLPNFLAGRILADADPAMAGGRASVIARMAPGPHLSPLGIEAPPTFTVLYRSSRDAAFGRAPDLRCPHFVPESGGCGIWRHRQAVCATWYCKFDRGQAGQRFWLAMLDLLRLAERALALHCVRTLAPSPAVLRHAAQQAREPVPLEASGLGGALDVDAYRRRWGAYAGREAEFFRTCAALVERMTWSDVLAAGGAELAVAADLVADAARSLQSRALPARLRLGALTLTTMDGDEARVVGYSGLDPLLVPRPLVDVLHVFDGRPVRDALAAAARLGVELDRAAVRRLVDFGVLEDAGTASTRPRA